MSRPQPSQTEMSPLVWVDSRTLDAAIRACPLGPSRLAARSGVSRQAVHTWLRRGARHPDGLVRLRLNRLEPFCAALGVALDDVLAPISRAACSADVDVRRLAALLGPRVHPGALQAVAPSISVRPTLQDSEWFCASDDGGIRFRSWALLEGLLSGAELRAGQAEVVADWCRANGVLESDAPELFCMVALARGRVREAADAGLAWMKMARNHGRFAEARWVGEQLLARDALIRETSLETFGEISLITARAARFAGYLDRALEIIAGVRIAAGGDPTGALGARLLLELADVRAARDKFERAHRDAVTAFRRVESGTDRASQHARVEALMCQVYVGYFLDDPDASASALRALDAMRPSLPVALACQVHRQRAIAALLRGDLTTGVRQNSQAMSLASANGDHRERGIAWLNLAQLQDLRGDQAMARTAFANASRDVRASTPGPFRLALLELNFGEFEVASGRLDIATRRLGVCADQMDRAGDFPWMAARLECLRAEIAMRRRDWNAARAHATAALGNALECGMQTEEANALSVCAAAAPRGSDEARNLARAARELMEPRRDKLVPAYLMNELYLTVASVRARPSSRLEAAHKYADLALSWGFVGLKQRLETLLDNSIVSAS